MQSAMNDLKRQIGDLEGRNVLLEKQYNDLLRQHEEVSTDRWLTSECKWIGFTHGKSIENSTRIIHLSLGAPSMRIGLGYI